MKLAIAVAVAAVFAAIIGSIIVVQTDTAGSRRPGPGVRGAGVHRTTPVPHPARAVKVDPAPLMFCEPWIPNPVAGELGPVATIPENLEAEVVYRDGTCEPDVAADGTVAVMHADGSVERVTPILRNDGEVGWWYANDIIWTPAQGGDDASAAVITGDMFESADYEGPGTVGDGIEIGGIVSLEPTARGRELLEIWSYRIGGLPITVFVDGEQLKQDGLPNQFNTQFGSADIGFHGDEAQLQRIADIVNGE